MARPELLVREADYGDVEAIQEIYVHTYGEDYPYADFYELNWLRRSVATDDILLLVAEDTETGAILGTASVVFDVGAHSDLIGEFGRLAVHPDARQRGVGRELMEARVRFIETRLHAGIVENRTAHPYSQLISLKHGFVPVGLLPEKHDLGSGRESVALYVRHFGDALRLRCNHPRVTPEVYPLAHLSLATCGLEPDLIVEEGACAYPSGGAFRIEQLQAEGFSNLLRIERGRVRQREIFGPMRLHYGFFKLAARQATYLMARHPGGALAGAIGFLHSPQESAIRIFEFIALDDQVVRQLLEALMDQASKALGVIYTEVDVSAHATRMQATVQQLGFVPVAYVPAGVFHQVERLDVIKFAHLSRPPALDQLALAPASVPFADLVRLGFRRKAVLPRIAAVVPETALFQGLSPEQVQRVAGSCSVRSVAAGQRIFQAGSPSSEVLLVLRGTVEVRFRDGQAVGRVRAGETLGEIGVLTGRPHSAHADAVGDVELGVLQAGALAELNRLRPDIGLVIHRNLAIGLGEKLLRVDARLRPRPGA